MSHGTFCFMSFDGYGWYLSATAALLYCSYFTHNVVAWLKIRPFFTGPQPYFSPPYSVWVPRLYLATLALTIPALIFEIFNNFRFFNNLSRLYATVRPYEPFMRDPWWLFSCATLLHVIRRSYSLRIVKLVRKSPRFGIMLAAIFLAVCFTIVDILSTIVRPLSLTAGCVNPSYQVTMLTILRINPYWKLALVFKCLTDNILLDDFKSVLQRLGAMKIDGTEATMGEASSLHTHAKFGSTDHQEDPFHGNGPTALSHDSRASDQIGLADALNDGPEVAATKSKSKNSSSSGIGRYGVKIQKLPSLPFPGSTKKTTKES